MKQIFGHEGQLPCTLLVVDEIQQFIGEKIQRANDVQEIAEHCCTDLGSRLLLVGTGQSALNTTPSLQRLQARFAVRGAALRHRCRKRHPQDRPAQKARARVGHHDSAWRPTRANWPAICRTPASPPPTKTNKFFVADYPLLPTRRRFWEKVLRNTDHSGTKAQLRSQLQIVFEATRQTAAAAVGTVVPADFIYDQISTDLLNSGELEREYDEIIRKQRDGTPDGDLRSSLCALIFLIGKLPRTPGADDGVRANAETLVDLLVSDLKSRPARSWSSKSPSCSSSWSMPASSWRWKPNTACRPARARVWTHDFNRRRTAALNDDPRINSKRAELLRDGAKQALKPVSLQQGTSRQPRKLAFELSSSRPDHQQRRGHPVGAGWLERRRKIGAERRPCRRCR